MARRGLAPREVVVDGVRLRYVRGGRGETVVLLHGFASSLYTWSEVWPHLAARFDLVAPDLPAFGGSAIEPRVAARDYPKLVLRFLDAVGVRRASFVGNSMGGGLAVVMAASTPDRVDRLVLLDSMGYNLAPADRPGVLRLAGAPGLGEAADRLPLSRALVTLGLRQVFHDPGHVTPERVDEYLAPVRRAGAGAAMRALLRGTHALGLPEAIGSVVAPTLVIWGEDDRWIPVRDAARFAAAIPGARVVVLPACGHLPQEERPREVAALLSAFLSSPQGPTSDP